MWPSQGDPGMSVFSSWTCLLIPEQLVHVLVRVPQRNGANRTHLEEEIYYKELVHAIVQAEKPQDLPSASWRLWNAGGVFPAQIQRAENHRCQGREKIDVPAQASRQEETNYFSLRFFVLFLPSTGLITAARTGEGKLLYWVHWSKW